MNRVIALLLLASLAACGSGNGGSAATPADGGGNAVAPGAQANPWPDTVELPRLGTVGDLPPADRRVVLAISADGTTWVDGVPGDLAAFDRALAALADAGDPAGIDVVIAGDARLPWVAAQHVLQRVAGSLLSRTWFVARHDGDESTGALALFLPTDIGVIPPGRDLSWAKLTVQVRDGWPPSNPLALHTRLQPHCARGGVIEIDAAASTPLGLVLKIADVAALQGCTSVTLVGTPEQAPDGLPGLVAAAGDKPARKLSILGVEPTEIPVLIPAPERVRGPAGFTMPLAETMAEIEVEVPEDD